MKPSHTRAVEAQWSTSPIESRLAIADAHQANCVTISQGLRCSSVLESMGVVYSF